MNNLKNEIETLTVSISMTADAINTLVYKLMHKYKDSITSSEWKGIRDSDEMYQLLAQMQMCKELIVRCCEEVV